jgi:hypothetical protein
MAVNIHLVNERYATIPSMLANMCIPFTSSPLYTVEKDDASASKNQKNQKNQKTTEKEQQQQQPPQFLRFDKSPMGNHDPSTQYGITHHADHLLTEVY